MAVQFLGLQLVLGFTLLFTYLEGGWSLTAVGVTGALSPGIAFALGFACYLPFRSICHLAWRLGGSSAVDEIAFLAARAGWPRHPAAKAVDVVATCLLNPVTEELMYRGILVLLFGSLIGSYVFSISIGLLLCLGAHLYQGPRQLPYHALFYAFTVALLFSPLGLVGSVGLHFAGDLLPSVQSRRNVREWKAHLQRRRRGAAPLSKERSC
jgi:membrane protease YdiL (CAAX protease family)